VPLSQSTLAQMFKGPVFADEPSAIAQLSAGWNTYLSGATCAGVPANPVLLVPAVAAFSAQLVGMSAPGLGLPKLTAAMVASWGVVAASAIAIFAPAPIVSPGTPPPLLGTMAVALAPVFLANVAQKKSRDEAADAVAAVLHALNLGAVAPGPLAPLPIL
jgi:hypothetical protein